MFVAGDYKISKVIRMKEEGGVYYIDVEEYLKTLESECDDPREIAHEKQELSAITEFTKDGRVIVKFPIPEGTTQEEIDDAIKHGANVKDGYVLQESGQGKVENGEFYLHDESMFLTGEEWVKISTDTKGEINMITYIYSLI